MTNNSNDVIARTGQAASASPAVTLISLHCSEAALPSASPFLVFTSLHLVEICTLTSTFQLWYFVFTMNISVNIVCAVDE